VVLKVRSVISGGTPSRTGIPNVPRPIGFPVRLTLEVMNRRSNIYRALEINPGTAVYFDEQRFYARNLEVPSVGAVGTARAAHCA
jgi:hypothetical protein